MRNGDGAGSGAGAGVNEVGSGTDTAAFDEATVWGSKIICEETRKEIRMKKKR